MKDEVIEKLIAIIREDNPGISCEITGDSSVAYDLGLDSFSIYQLIMLVEEEFDITVELEELDRELTISELADKIIELKQA